MHCAEMALDASVFVHEKALCESEQVGLRTRVWPFAHVMAGAVIGNDCNICEHTFIESGAVIGNRVTVKNNVMVWDRVTIEDDVFLGPGAILTNDRFPRAGVKTAPVQLLPTLIKRGATIGAGAVVRCGTTIGNYAFIGAGSVVLNDVAAHALVVGNPVRRIGWICQCGIKLVNSLMCDCGRRYALVSEEQGLRAG
jgi:UDP-2-acetamido-3-amino-2,3-dideoxy-glucuronate N-acetyltransferase